MPRRKLTHSRADVKAMWELMKKLGEEPVSVKYHDDGTFRIMTRKHVEAKYGPAGQATANPWDQELSHAPL